MRIKNKLSWILFIISFSGKIITAQTNCGMPDVQLFGTSKTDTTATPYWQPVSGATAYNFRYRIRNMGFDYSTPVQTTNTSYTLTNLQPSTDYEFIVQTVCGIDTSSYSPSGWFTTFALPTAPIITRGPFMTVSSSSGVTIQWSTSGECNSEVYYGTSPGNLQTLAADQNLTKEHVIQLSNLNANTKYYYSIGTSQTILEATTENYFLTAPVANDSVPLRFWVTGDFGTGFAAQTQVRDAFVNYTAGQPVNGWLWLGDNAYSNGTDQEYQDKVFDVYPSQMKNIPLFPAPGNHDYAQCGYLSPSALTTNFPYFNIFSLPNASGTEKYYSADYGNVHLIALDSYGAHNDASSPMYTWLQADLAANDRQWTIVYFHHPPYSKGSHDSDNSVEMVDMRTHIIPLLESYGVDLVLSGHSHAYERSYFMKNHYGTSGTFSNSNKVQLGGGPYDKTSRTGNGTVYIVCGVSGKVTAPVAGFPHDAMYYSTATKYGSLVIDVNGNSLNCKFLTSDGNIEDEFGVSKPSMEITSNVPSIAGQSLSTVDVFPNPVDDRVNVRFNNKEEISYSISVSNMLGQTVWEQFYHATLDNPVLSFSRTDLHCSSPGVYYMSFISPKGTDTKQIIMH